MASILDVRVRSRTRGADQAGGHGRLGREGLVRALVHGGGVGEGWGRAASFARVGAQGRLAAGPWLLRGPSSGPQRGREAELGWPAATQGRREGGGPTLRVGPGRGADWASARAWAGGEGSARRAEMASWAEEKKGEKRILAQGRRRKISFLWIKEFGIRFKGFLKRGLRGEFREEFKRIQRSLRRTPTERSRRDSLRLWDRLNGDLGKLCYGFVHPKRNSKP